MFQLTNQGIIIKVKVIPKASRSEIVGWENDELKIRLSAEPEKGEANDELVRFLADIFSIGKINVRLLQGQTSRHKRMCISNLSIENVKQIVDMEVEMRK